MSDLVVHEQTNTVCTGDEIAARRTSNQDPSTGAQPVTCRSCGNLGVHVYDEDRAAEWLARVGRQPDHTRVEG